MVRETNTSTSWDNAAGKYVVKSVEDWDTDRFAAAHRAHLGDGSPAPLIEHPQLDTLYFHYLSKDGSGHFQVGRGFVKQDDGDRFIHIFEPWNEADWYPDGNRTWGPRSVTVLNMLKANKANRAFQNIGL